MKNQCSNSDRNSTELSVHKGLVITGLANHGYLGAWFETLKHSPHYIQMCRSGIFASEASFRTFEMFGSIEDLNYEQWWSSKGIEKFGSASIQTEAGYSISYQFTGTAVELNVCLTLNRIGKVQNIEEVSSFISNKFRGLLSDKPEIWPFFKAKISTYSIEKSLSVVKACQKFTKNGKFKMWEIGEQLNLKKNATTQPDDWHIDMIDKHINMGKLVSAENKRGMNLALNASQGVFPSFSSR